MLYHLKVGRNKCGEFGPTERDSTQEMEALQALVQQLEKWREETESELTISQRMTDKMKQEKQAIADEKRSLVRLFLIRLRICIIHRESDLGSMSHDLRVHQTGDNNHDTYRKRNMLSEANCPNFFLCLYIGKYMFVPTYRINYLLYLFKTTVKYYSY